MSEKTMRAAQIHEFGGPELLQLQEVARPEPKEGQVLVRLAAAGVNPADWKMRSGYYQKFMPLPLPWIPGLEGAGVVEAVGPDVTAFSPGQAVLGLFSSAYAEFAVAPATDLFLKPDELSFEQAASIPLGALTAWQAVIEEVEVQAGQRVLIHGGAGGVGLYAVQLAKWKGAYVITTASAANAEYVRSLGADTVIDYQTTKFEDVAQNVDAVIDTVGGDLVERSLPIIKSGGIFVTVAARVDPEVGTPHNVRATSARRADVGKMRQILELVEQKRLTVGVGQVFPLEQANAAHVLSETGHGRGRIVLVMK